jgi:hypothetical protein
MPQVLDNSHVDLHKVPSNSKGMMVDTKDFAPPRQPKYLYDEKEEKQRRENNVRRTSVRSNTADTRCIHRQPHPRLVF